MKPMSEKGLAPRARAVLCRIGAGRPALRRPRPWAEARLGQALAALAAITALWVAAVPAQADNAALAAELLGGRAGIQQGGGAVQGAVGEPARCDDANGAETKC